MCIYILIRTSTTFRGLASILETQRLCNMIQILKTPSHTSLRRWINQVGYYNLHKPLENTHDWIYFIDNSMRIENRKVCLILGAQRSKLRKGKYLTYEDLESVEIRIIEKNNDLEMIIEDAIARTGIPIQICSDKGSDIMPSIRKVMTKHSKIKHIPDIMHKTGNMLKKRLEKDQLWQSFITLLNDSKKRLCLSSLSFMCPPNLRGKSRFLNCQNGVEWASRTIVVLENMNTNDPNWLEMNKKLGWLVPLKQDILVFRELFHLAGMAKEIVRKLHIDKDVWQIAEELFENDIKSCEGKLFAKELVDFLKEQCEKADEGVFLVGSSEIIESAFSKLKLLDRECGNSGFTLSVLGLGACFGAIDHKSVVKAFETVDYSDVFAWGIRHVGETIQKKRRRVLKFQKGKDLSLKLTRFMTEKIKAA